MKIQSKSLSILALSCAITFSAITCGSLDYAANADETDTYTRPLHDPLDKIPLRDCKTVLTELANLRLRYCRGEDVKFPRVVLHLRSGKDLYGFVVKLGVFDQSTMVELALLEAGERFNEPSMAFVNVANVDAVSILQVGQLRHYLSFGETPQPDVAAAPTKLDIKRKAVRFSAILTELIGAPITVEVDWAGITETDQCLRNLAGLMSDADGELAGLCDVAFNRAEMSRKVHTITFAAGDRLTAHLDKGGNLSIAGPVAIKNTFAVDRVQLKETIQKAL